MSGFKKLSFKNFTIKIARIPSKSTISPPRFLSISKMGSGYKFSSSLFVKNFLGQIFDDLQLPSGTFKLSMVAKIQ
jgi:hypothetical protein